MAGALERPGTGLVSNAVFGTGEQTIGAACENLHLNGFTACSIAAAEIFARHPIVIGKSMLFRREALLSAGGFEAAADVLAEDYLLGKAVRDAGYRVTTIGYPVWAINRTWPLSKMLQRHVRWAQIRRHVSPLTFLFEPFALPDLWLALVMLFWCALPMGGDSRMAVVECCLLMAAIGLQLSVPALLLGSKFNWASLVWLPFSSGLALVAWARAWTLDVVVWRNQSYRIGAGSRLSILRPQRVTHSRQARMPEAA
jgi:ceramide glucosyltransferase